MKIGEHYEIKVLVIANNTDIGVGDCYDSFEELVKENPHSSYTFGFAVVDTRNGLIPAGCNDWNDSPEEALFDYLDNVEGPQAQAEAEIEKMAKEVRQFLLDNGLWIDVDIFFSMKAFSTNDRKGHFAYNDPTQLFVIENVFPAVKYHSDILNMKFNGPLGACLNYCSHRGHDFDESIQNGLRAIFEKRGMFYELGTERELGVYPIGSAK